MVRQFHRWSSNFIRFAHGKKPQTFAGLGFLTLSTILAGCASGANERNPAPCPNVLVLQEAARVIEFDGDAALENIAYSGEVVDVSLNCRYFDDKPITGDLNIQFDLGRGPAGTSGQKDFVYFVAVTRRNLEVIAKEEFAIRANFKGAGDTVRIKEKIDKLVIPRAGEKTSGTNFEVVVGFSLTRDQVRFNRSGKSLKFPNL